MLCPGFLYSGFVLVGGRSSRMGTDKALLPYRGKALVSYVAGEVRAAAGSATLIGDPVRYGDLGYQAIPDAIPNCGPLGGVVTALRSSTSDWNLVVACDMPAISADFLRCLLAMARMADGRCVVPLGRLGPEPLCAAYHRASLPVLEQALASKLLKMQEVIKLLEPVHWPPPETDCLANINTPEEWVSERA